MVDDEKRFRGSGKNAVKEKEKSIYFNEKELGGGGGDKRRPPPP